MNEQNLENEVMRSSFKLTRNSKGVSVAVKIYAYDDDKKIDEARQLAEKHFQELCKKYKQES